MSAMNVPATERESPGEMARKILESSAYHSIRKLSCTFRNGELTLSGELPSYHLKQVAQTAVQGIKGIHKIDNQIEVST